MRWKRAKAQLKLTRAKQLGSEETVHGETVRNSDVLTTQDGVRYQGGQVVVPRALRKELLQCLHASHQGLDATMRRARDVFTIQQVTSECRQCEENQPAQPKQSLASQHVPGPKWEWICFNAKDKSI